MASLSMPDSHDTTAPEASLIVNAQYTKDLSFECPKGFDAFLPREKAPDIEVAIRVNAHPIQETIHEVVLELKCQAQAEDGVLFLIELHYAGVFTLTGVEPSLAPQILLIECPRLLFPFARAIIADITRDSGFAPLVLSPVNFAALYTQHLQDNANGAATLQEAGLSS